MLRCCAGPSNRLTLAYHLLTSTMPISSFYRRLSIAPNKVLWSVAPASVALGLCCTFGARAPLQAAPKVAPAKSMSFDLTARFSYSGEGSPMPEQTVAAKIYVAGNRVRVESELAGRPLVVLYAPPYAYRLLPSSKTGVRYRAEALPDLTQKIFGTRDVMPNPQSIRSALQKAGAKRSGGTSLSGTPVDIWSVANFRGKGNSAKAWLRRSDSLPLRFEMNGPKLKAAASWKNYQIGRVLPATLFTVPKNYRISERSGGM